VTFDKAFKAISSAEWDWTAAGFEKTMTKLRAKRANRSTDMPSYNLSWDGRAQAIIDGAKVRRVEFFLDVTEPGDDGFTSDEMDELGEQYERKFADCRARAEKLLGKPKKVDGNRAEWKLPTAKLTLKWTNAGEITPFWISIVATRS
jgi:hypothetical protein